MCNITTSQGYWPRVQCPVGSHFLQEFLPSFVLERVRLVFTSFSEFLLLEGTQNALPRDSSLICMVNFWPAKERLAPRGPRRAMSRLGGGGIQPWGHHREVTLPPGGEVKFSIRKIF